MKYIYAMFGLVIVMSIPQVASGQSLNDIRIKALYDDRPLHLVLLDLELKYRLNFIYDKKEITNINVTAEFRKSPIVEVMEVLLQGTRLGYQTEGKKITIKSKLEVPKELDKSSSKPTRTNFTVSGVVKDVTNGERLPYANIGIKGTSSGTDTNVDGYFTLFNVPSDTSVLVLNYLGYQETNFRLTPDLDISNLQIQVSPSGLELETILVKAVKEEQMIKASTGVSSIGLSPATLSSLPSFGEKDIFRSLQLLPGVSGTNESSSGLFIRGGTPDQNLVLLDGFTVYHVDHLFGFFSAFNSSAIKDIQLHKGGYDAQFGGRLSSVVEMTGKDGNTEEFNMGLGLSMLSYNGFVEAPFASGKGSFLVAGRRSFQSKFYTGLFDSFTGIGGQEEIPQGPQGGGGRFANFGQQEVKPNSYFYDLNAKLTYRFGTKDVVSLSFYNGQDNLDNSRITDNNSFGGFRGGGGGGNFDFASANKDLSNWGNVGSSLKWSRKWNNTFYSKITASYSNYFSERDRRNETTVVRDAETITRNTGSYELNDLQDATLTFDNQLKVSQNNQLDFGIQITNNDIEYEFNQNDTLNLVNRDDQGVTSAFYIQDKITISDQLVLKGGLRTVHYQPTASVYLEPRAALTYFLTDRIKIKGAYGKYNQFANRIVREDIQQGSRDFWLLSDGVNIPVGTSSHYIAGISYETSDYIFDIESYYKNLDGLSEYTTRLTTTGRGPQSTLNYQELFYAGSGKSQGVEFLLQKKTGRLTGWVGYTLGQVKYDFEDFGDQPFFANQDQTHEAKIVASYKLGRWDLASTFIYATGKPYTAPTGYYEIPLIDGSTESYFEVSSKNGLRLPDYHRMDISGTYNFFLGKSKASIGLSIMNIYNRSNIWYKEYEVIEGELLESNISLIDFTPSLFVTWELN